VALRGKWILVLAVHAQGCQPTDARSGSVEISTEVEQCPLIEEVSVVPLEVVVGGRIDVSATPSFGTPETLWRAKVGRFDDPRAEATTYLCTAIGAPVLTFMLWEERADCEDWVDVRVTCSADPLCGDGDLDSGEECDDGNTEPGDGCSARCRRKLRLGPD
jgi:cysteine-rich repeat protein